MFNFEAVEKGRILEGEYASKPGEQQGCFLIPLSEKPIVRVQAKTKIIEGWEILEAEEIIRLPDKKEKRYEKPLTIEEKYRAKSMPMGVELVKDLKLWFWGPGVDCVMFIPKIEDGYINTHPYLVRIVRHENASISIPHFLR